MMEYLLGLFATPRMIVAQVLGLFAVVSMVICFTRKKRKTILLWQIFLTALWTIHFLLLGVPTGAATNGLMVLRNILFYYKDDKKWAQNPFWFWLIMALILVAGGLTWDSAWSILPILGSIFSTVSMWMKKPFHIRLLCLPVSGCWIVYNAVFHSLPGVCNEVIAIATMLYAIFTIDLPAKKNLSNLA